MITNEIQTHACINQGSTLKSRSDVIHRLKIAGTSIARCVSGGMRLDLNPFRSHVLLTNHEADLDFDCIPSIFISVANTFQRTYYTCSKIRLTENVFSLTLL